MRQIVLDTETTGLDPNEGHRVIELGCVELVERRPTGNDYHIYLNPERSIDDGALEVHGITREFLADKPRFSDVAVEVLDYLSGAELIIHNAPFDLGFLNSEFGKANETFTRIEKHCSVIDTLVLARELHPGQRNSLDALCSRYAVDNTSRTLHGALLDARILADVYLAMTGGQASFDLTEGEHGGLESSVPIPPEIAAGVKVIRATAAELTLHEARLESIDEASGEQCRWLRMVADERQH
jgi:DNA polymerase-3 subunit epsilon